MNKRTLFTLIVLLIITPLGFFTKFYTGSGSAWVNNSLGGVFYEIFWCLLIFLIYTKLKPVLIATAVFLITCALEFTQLWKPEFLEILRENFLVRTVIGNSFAWSDFPYYLIGSLAGLALMEMIKRKTKN
ncbi:MAG: DUF2809 domain-containing protein [Candidatus Cloacimonetes bacterium]|nr:DUF2809 domain-containing protein [Candidatus Cloacimonadota bacterium]